MFLDKLSENMHCLVGFDPIELLNYGKMSQNLGQNYPDHGNF